MPAISNRLIFFFTTSSSTSFIISARASSPLCDERPTERQLISSRFSTILNHHNFEEFSKGSRSYLDKPIQDFSIKHFNIFNIYFSNRAGGSCYKMLGSFSNGKRVNFDISLYITSHTIHVYVMHIIMHFA